MKLSIVIPALNEEKNILQTIDELRTAIRESGDLVDAHEIIVIDDHSTDNTFGVVANLNSPDLRAIRLSRRSGSHMAIRAGLAAATGDGVLCISADGQDDARMLFQMLERLQDGYNIVWALRKGRGNEPLAQRLFAKSFYCLLTWFGSAPTGIDLSRADFYLLDNKVVTAINACPERNTSLFGLVAWLGFQQGWVEYDRKKRRAGTSGWNFHSRLRLATDWIIAFSGVPLKLMTISGFLIAGLGFLYALLVITRSILFGSPLVGWSSVMTAILLLGGGQIMMLGIIGEYLWRTLDESRNRPAYFIEKDSHPLERHNSC
jgi:dolichol-phosphate mannosyltransferase